MKIYRKDFIEQLREQCGYTKEAATEMVRDFWKVVDYNVQAGNDMVFTGFGSFVYRDKDEASVHGPDGNIYLIPAHRVIKFVPGTAIKTSLKIYTDNLNRGLE